MAVAAEEPAATEETSSRIQVAVRVRPRDREDVPVCWLCEPQRITQLTGPNGKPLPGSAFAFDRVFSEHETTCDIYDSFVRPLALSVLSGINGLFCSSLPTLCRPICSHMSSLTL